jgi:hypothetical protein
MTLRKLSRSSVPCADLPPLPILQLTPDSTRITVGQILRNLSVVDEICLHSSGGSAKTAGSKTSAWDERK